MDGIASKVAPTILVFVLGFLLKKVGALDRRDGETLLKVFFYVAVPALIFLSVAKMDFSLALLWLPVISILVILTTFLLAHPLQSVLKLDRSSFGVLLVGTLIMNTGFVYPFLVATLGEEGLARASLFDFGNTALAYTFIYYLACRHGENSSSGRAMLRKFLLSPPLLALIVALIVNLWGLRVPEMAGQFLGMTGYMSGPLMMLALGIYFNPVATKMLPLFSAVFVRMGIGLLLGFLFVTLFDLDGLSRTVVLICSSAPAGITTLVFSSMEKLDHEYAASIVSYSVLIGIFLVPILIRYA